MRLREPRAKLVTDMPFSAARCGQHAAPTIYTSRSSGGTSACRTAASSRPALILLDFMMPRMDGLEVVAALRADAALASIPVVFVSASPAVAASGMRFSRKPVLHEAVPDRAGALRALASHSRRIEPHARACGSMVSVASGSCSWIHGAGSPAAQ